MIDILGELHKYVPKSAADYESGEGSPGLQQMCFGGDQLMVARARKGRTVRTNARDPTNALRGLVPLAADWHTKVNFMSVSSQLTIHFH